MKNIVVGVLTLIIVATAGWVASKGGAYNGGERGKIIVDVGNKNTITPITQPQEKSDDQKVQEKIDIWKKKIGNIGKFKVSDAFANKCKSCHGVNGGGSQGPKLFGQSEEAIYKKLSDFKSGKKENVFMKGLLIPMSDDDLKSFAKEIGEFPARAKAQQENK